MRGERGSSLIELALLLPILTLMAAGVIEVGRYAELSIRVANAARAGLQYGSQSLANASDTPGIKQAASFDAPNAALIVTPTLVCYCSGSPCVQGIPCMAPNTQTVYLKITASGTFAPIIPYRGLPNLTSVSTTAQMRVSQ